MIGAIILAAGTSRRFGDDKRKAVLLSGHNLLETSIQNTASVIDEVLVVLRFDDQTFASALKANNPHDNVSYLCAPDSAMGMAHSLANGIARVTHWDGALLFLGDMPFVQAKTIESILIEFENRHQSRSPIIIPTKDGNNGHPVMFSNSYFNEIQQLTGDRGAKPIIDRHADSVFKIEVDDPGILQDIDTPQDITTSR